MYCHPQLHRLLTSEVVFLETAAYRVTPRAELDSQERRCHEMGDEWS